MKKSFFPLLLIILVVSACATTTEDKSPQNVIYSDDGLSTLSLPDNWGKQISLNTDASIQIGNPSREQYLIVISESVDNGNQSLSDYSEAVATPLAQGLSEATISEPLKITLGSHEALQRTISGKIGELGLSYISTTMKGNNAYYHILAWTLSSMLKDNEAELKRASGSFRELAQPREKQQRIVLNFQWPGEINAQVSYTDKETKNGKEKNLQIDYKMLVSATERGYLIQNVDTKSTSSGGEGPEQNKLIQDFLESMLGNTPDYLVSSEGQLLQVVNMDKFMNAMNSAVDKFTTKFKDKQTEQRFRAMIEPVFSEQFFLRRIRAEWGKEVANWAGSVFVQGEKYVSKAMYQAPVLNNKQFPMTITTTLEGIEPCIREKLRRECVLIKQVELVQDNEFQKAMEDYLSNLAKQKVEVSNMRVQTTTHVLTEKETLLPHRITSEKVTMMDILIAGEKKRSSQTEHEETHYQYIKTFDKQLSGL